MVHCTQGRGLLWPRRLAGLGLLVAVAMPVSSQAASVTLTETGSTLIYPLFQAWVSAYASVSPDLKVTLAATDSSKGIADVISGQVAVGTSDAYMGDHEKQDHPQILNIPLVISAQTVDVNLPDLHGTAVKLSGPVLAGIYSGRVRDWDDPAITALNAGVTLPHHAIVPVRRQDASGDTFIFTQFLSFSTQSWENGPGYGTAVNWPAVPNVQTATSNAGMVKLIANTPYSLGYVGGSFETEAAKAGLQIAPLQNADGAFVMPTPETVTAAAAVLTPRTPPDERLTLVFAQGPNSYPLINYEYAIVSSRQPDAATAAAVRDLLLWCVNPQGGSTASFLGPVNFITLPTSIRALTELQIAKIQ